MNCATWTRLQGDCFFFCIESVRRCLSDGHDSLHSTSLIRMKKLQRDRSWPSPFALRNKPLLLNIATPGQLVKIHLIAKKLSRLNRYQITASHSSLNPVARFRYLCTAMLDLLILECELWYPKYMSNHKLSIIYQSCTELCPVGMRWRSQLSSFNGIVSFFFFLAWRYC